MTKVALLLSGGMDSYSLAYLERPDIVVTMDYGQKPAAAELKAAAFIADHLEIEHILISVDLSHIGSGDLAGSPALDEAPASDWWPYRNQAIITLAAMRLIAENIDRLLIGTVSSDSNHQDGTTRFIHRMNSVMSMQEGSIQVEAPAIHLSTVELVRKSGIPPSLLAWAHSCHTENISCGQCRGCIKHREVVEELGYAKSREIGADLSERCS